MSLGVKISDGIPIRSICACGANPHDNATARLEAGVQFAKTATVPCPKIHRVHVIALMRFHSPAQRFGLAEQELGAALGPPSIETAIGGRYRITGSVEADNYALGSRRCRMLTPPPNPTS